MAKIDIVRKLFGWFKPSRKTEDPSVIPDCEGQEIPESPEEKEDLADLLAITCIGHSHIKHNTVCQDSSLHHKGENFRFIAVSDGHGSSSFPRSDRGSRLACSVALDVCKEFVQRGTLENREQAARDLCQEIVSRWTAAVLADHAADPFDEATLEGVSEKYREHFRAGNHIAHAYGSTLIAVLETAAGTLAIRCGDGECIAIDRQGKFTRPIPWNDKCDVNVTTSLCDKDAIDEFRWTWMKEAPAAVWIGTDGVDNSYTVPEDLNEFYANLSVRVLDQGCAPVMEELEQFLPVLTKRCSQDDLSVAAMVSHSGLRAARSRLYAYVDYRNGLRELVQLQRRLKQATRAWEDKERELARPEGVGDAFYQEISALRQEVERITQQLTNHEEKLAQLCKEAGLTDE